MESINKQISKNNFSSHFPKVFWPEFSQFLQNYRRFLKFHFFGKISKFSSLNVFEEVAPRYSATWWRYFSASCRHDVTNLCHQNPSVIWSDLSKLTHVMFVAFAKKKYAQHKIAYVTRKNPTSRSFLKMTSDQLRPFFYWSGEPR